MKSLKLMLAATAAVMTLSTAAPANTLKWGAARDIDSLDPYAFGSTFTLAFLNHVYEGLVRYDANLKIEPALAESWEIVEPTVWRFKLRKGVKFHNGSDFTADDAMASLKRISHETSPLKGNLPAYKDARKIDDHTVDIMLNSAYPLLLNDLTNVFMFDKEWLVANNSELPTDVAKGVEGYATHHANGTGPFMLESRRPDAKTILVVNPKWWDAPRHNLTRIEFTPIASAPTRVAALLSGDINYTEAAPLQDLQRLQASPEVKTLLSTELRTVFFALNFKDRLTESDVKDKNPLKDRRVRRALYQGLAMDQMQKRAMRGLSRNTGALVAPAIPGYTPDMDARLPFDAEGAKKLLAEAGYPNGFSLSLVCSTDSYVNEEEICQSAAAMWARIGIKANLSSGPRSIQNPKRVKGEFDITTLGWANEPMIDAYSILVQVMHGKTGSAGVFNWGNWGHPRIDELTDKAANELNPEKRIPMMSEALKIAKEEILFLPLHQQPMAWATRTDVTGAVQLSDNKARHWFTRMK
ncbi:ABC transporter substrate-binding protein [Chelatococcus sp. SYSU_G07232]|uniref:ABC transporter substrate-binding protein n=1 Tax=Chelatococcus albus TaxID=3047466 RepID=A0ABT7AD79_9HYPH|nr:ABC transporter substrate-binding protein [Chelatococcus sp. SYSU_G07232]MDJ1157337.1 ABC transporter substrate-binding protein [Chelatococcus sp. SYSU_G07232]